MSRRVAINAVWNLFGVGLPILAGIMAVPMLLHGLGSARLGVFSLALGLFGFSGLFDFGLGRALTQTVASEQGKGSSLAAIAGLVRQGLLAVLILGVVWGGVLWIGATPIVRDLFHLTDSIALETIQGIHWLAITLPLVLLSASLIGLLEGLQHFRNINFLRAPIGAATFLVPAVIAQTTNDLGWVIAGLALTRVLGVVLWGLIVIRSFPLFDRHEGSSLNATAMWRFTGWLSVSNLVSPIMVYADRFYLASVFPPAVVALYTVPLDALLRATVLPSSAMNAAFPALAHLGAKAEHESAQKIIRSAGWLMMGLWFLPVLVVGALLPFLLTIWLGSDFAQRIFTISQWILLGVLANGFAYIPFALLQSAGRSDLTAKLHMLELPFYAVALVYLVSQFGITGAAIAWFGRVLFDAAVLYGVAFFQFDTLRRVLGQLAIRVGIAILSLMGALMLSAYIQN